MNTGHAQQTWNAADYAEFSSGQLRWARELIGKLSMHGNESLLDIGCGEGKVSAEIAQGLPEGYVLGIDLSKDMIEYAKENFPPAKFSNLEFRCMDAGAIRLERHFDMAFSNAALHWVEDHVAVLQGIHSVLNTGGRILLQMGGRGNAAEIFDVIHGIMTEPDLQSYYKDFVSPYYFYGPEEYTDWLSRCGFHANRVELIEKDLVHRDREAFLGWLRTTWFPFAAPLPEEKRESFYQMVLGRYEKIHPADSRGSFHVRMIRLEVDAVSI